MSDDYAEQVNRINDGWMKANDVVVTKATLDEIVVEMTVGPQHLQPLGVVHGGVHCGLVETIASIGAGIHALLAGKTVVGLENQTSFIRAVRGGTLRGVGKPITRGRRSHVWQADIYDGDGKLVSTGRVRVLVLDAGAQLAGETAALLTPTGG